MPATTQRNLFLALFLSLILTLVSVVLYALYPLVSALLSSMRNPGTGGIAAVTGGVSVSFLKLALIELILFLVIFAVLQKRRVRRKVVHGPGPNKPLGLKGG